MILYEMEALPTNLTAPPTLMRLWPV